MPTCQLPVRAFTALEPMHDGHRWKGRWLSEGSAHAVVDIGMGVFAHHSAHREIATVCSE